jgi:hypothetical protein
MAITAHTERCSYANSAMLRKLWNNECKHAFLLSRGVWKNRCSIWKNAWKYAWASWQKDWQDEFHVCPARGRARRECNDEQTLVRQLTVCVRES